MGFDPTLTRKEFLGLSGGLLLPWAADASEAINQSTDALTVEDLAAMEKGFGLNFSAAERTQALNSVRRFKRNYEAVAKLSMPNSVAPASHFIPMGRQPAASTKRDVRIPQPRISRPKNDDDLAFLTLLEHASLIKSRQITSVELTKFFLKRLATYGPKLLCVITLLEKSALAEAEAADQEIKAGKWRGPLHGIPTGVKDLFALKGHRTTWGAAPFQNQVTDFDSAVVEKLREAGAVICAKLTLGALAMGDQWYGGMTRNPWNPKEGSSGSSAGSASAVSAGLLPFAIGTETLGSIVSPSQRCRVTGLRPTFGRISRHGAMALSWSMDKVGPIARTAEDALLVLAALCGSDSRDPASVDRPLVYRSGGKLGGLKIAMLEGDTALDKDDAGDTNWKAQLVKLGIELAPIKITPPDDAATLGLSVEAAAAFSDITRSGAVNTVERSAWPGIFRAHHYVSAVELLQSLRARTLLMERFERELGDLDVVVAGDRGSHLLITTNLTGHPQLYVPLGLDAKGRSRGVSLIGRLYREDQLVQVAAALQKSVDFHRQKPDLSLV